MEYMRMSNKVVKPLALALVIGSVALASAANANTAFQMKPLMSGYMLAGTEGKCGEGKCGATKGKKCMEMKEKADQDKCMADAHKPAAGDKKGSEKSCGADKKGAEKSCGADKKGTEKSCGADKKGTEKSCGADKKKEG